MRLQRIFVRGLVGRFDHEIRMNLDDRITIIHGPNGFGKTILLRLLAGFFGTGFASLDTIPFRELQLDFETGETITVEKVLAVRDRPDEVDRPSALLHFAYIDGSGKKEFDRAEDEKDNYKVSIHMIGDLVPELEHLGPNLWRHEASGDFFSTDDVLARFSDRLPVSPGRDVPDWLTEVRGAVHVKLIQAERLQAEAGSRVRLHRTRVSKTTRAVKRYSDELAAVIQQTLTEFASLSQSLDRTFPARVVTLSSPLSNEDLQEHLKDIERRRARLVEAGLLGQEGDDPTMQVPDQVDEARRTVLSVYVQDTYKKLSVFDQLVDKVEIFKKSINQRFLYKHLSVGRDGFKLTTPEGEWLDPTGLSSGEQHEIVLLYELLFKAEKNSLVLIDEPEISLHVAWQEQFLPDLRAVTSLSKFDALIATHSPQVIGDRWDLTVELKGPHHEGIARTSSSS